MEKCITIEAVSATNDIDKLKAKIQDTFVEALRDYGTDLTATVECDFSQVDELTPGTTVYVNVRVSGLEADVDIGAVIDDETFPVLDEFTVGDPST
ncbi:MAG: hypothetical protein ACI9EZ_002186 [Halobacteriales archaeon]|jgi:hypothetical protein